jgi:hypothetical protein
MFVSRTAAWQRRTQCVNPFRLLGEPKFFEFLLPRFPLESGQSGPGQRPTVGAGEKGRAGERDAENPKNDDIFFVFDVNDQ